MGIEPTMADLQSAALPLGYPAEKGRALETAPEDQVGKTSAAPLNADQGDPCTDRHRERA